MNLWLALLLMLMLAATACVIHVRWKRRCDRLRRQIREREAQSAAFQEEYKLTEAQTRAQQMALFNSMTEGVLLLGENNEIQLVNESLQTMFGLTRDVRGQTILEAFRFRELEDLLKRLPSEGSVQDLELEMPGMEERWLQVNGASIVDEGKVHRGSILVFHDLTRMRQLENTRQEFVANVSHELRTPLSLIKGYVETLLDGALHDEDNARKFLQTIEKHTDRLTYLIEDILTISKLESGQILMNRHPVPLHAEANKVRSDLQDVAAERKVTIENRIPEDLKAMVDVDRLEQVFFNLVENAIKYGSINGCVEIGGKVSSGKDENKVELWVRDDGPGIPAEAQDRVFERFFRVDRARSRETGGTGLGLSIVKHIVQAHGGEVWLKSSPGAGTTFFLTLPTR